MKRLVLCIRLPLKILGASGRRSMGLGKSLSITLLLGIGLALYGPAQQPPAGGRGRGGGMNAYPQRPPADPAALERGKALYGASCSFCHGADARGGEGGPNLL